MARITLFLSFFGMLAFAAASQANVPSETSARIDDIFAHLVKRVDMLEARDLQYRQQMGAMQKKLKRQDQDILTLRILLSHRNRETIHDRKDESEGMEEKYEKSTAGIQRRSGDKADSKRIRRQEVEMDVAFFATLASSNLHLGHNQNVAFDHVVTNEGSAYNPHVGLFVAPVAGTYVFSTTVTVVERDTTHFGFALNGNVITTIFVNGGDKWYDSSAQTIVLQLQKGDDISVQHTESDKSIAGNSHSLFSGFLLRQSFGSATVVG